MSIETVAFAFAIGFMVYLAFPKRHRFQIVMLCPQCIELHKMHPNKAASPPPFDNGQ